MNRSFRYASKEINRLANKELKKSLKKRKDRVDETEEKHETSNNDIVQSSKMTVDHTSDEDEEESKKPNDIMLVNYYFLYNNY
jgi:hypothetical protein